MIKRLLLYGVVAILTFAGLLYLNAYKPDAVKSLIIAIDKVGITDTGAAELRRINAIKKLDLTSEQRQVLMQHTVFLGATPEMVQLALGTPKIQTDPKQSASDGRSTWTYHFQEDSRPTVLEFEYNAQKKSYVLEKAYKGSVLDTAQQQ